MSPKRRDRAAPPPRPGEWEIRFAETSAANGWEDLCRHAPRNTREAYDLMRADPRPPQDSRHERLRGVLASRKFGNRELEQWQIEVTGGGRIWYAIDDDRRTVWVTHAATRHRKRRNRRSNRGRLRAWTRGQPVPTSARC